MNTTIDLWEPSYLLLQNNIPRRFRKEYVPGRERESETKYQEYLESGDAEIEDLFHTSDVVCNTQSSSKSYYNIIKSANK